MTNDIKYNTIMTLSLLLNKANEEQTKNNTTITKLTDMIRQNNISIHKLTISPQSIESPEIANINKELIENTNKIEYITNRLKYNSETHNMAFNALKQIPNLSNRNINVEHIEYDYQDEMSDKCICIEPITLTLSDLEDEYNIKSNEYGMIVWSALEKLQSGFKKLEIECKMVKNQLLTFKTILKPIITNEEYQHDLTELQDNIKLLTKARDIAEKEYKLQEQTRISNEIAELISKNNEYSKEIDELNYKNILVDNQIKSTTHDIITIATKE
jgi:hypothetical protein